MAPSVFLASCDAGNFEQTVRSPVDLAEYPDRPDALEGVDAARLWGVTEGGSEGTFEKLSPDDLVLFFVDGAYVGTGRVGTIVEDDGGRLGETFWEDAASAGAFTVEGFQAVSVPKAAVNRIFEYSDGYTPQELLRVASDRVDRSPAAIELALQQYTERNG